jgi:hypothetical protein
MAQDLFPDTLAWAQDNFGGVNLGRPDRKDRLVYSTACLAQQPGKSPPAVFNRKDLRCFYSLMHRPESTHDALLQGHFDQTKQAMNVPEAILLVSDTTELNFSSHHALHDDLGPIGEGHGRGLLQHNCLAVRARDGFLLGLAHQQLVTRQPVPYGQSSSQKQHRDRESQLWANGFAGVGHAPQGCLWVDVCDRGGDVFEALHASRKLQHHALIRACQDRCVMVERDGQFQSDYLMQFARRLPGQLDSQVQVTQKGGRPARTAQVKLAAGRVRIEPPVHLRQRRDYKPVTVWVERVWEPEPPPGEEALEWVLLSTLPARTGKELLLRRDWYARRWPTAEDYHQAEKTGCGEEKVRFQDGHSLGAMLALLSVVAVRVVQLRQAGRACPKEPAERVATPLEIDMLRQALRGEWPIETVGQFVHGVARLGGWLGRKCDGAPGWKTLWRGYERLRGLVEGVLLYQQMPKGQRRGAKTRNTRGHPQKPP